MDADELGDHNLEFWTEMSRVQVDGASILRRTYGASSAYLFRNGYESPVELLRDMAVEVPDGC